MITADEFIKNLKQFNKDFGLIKYGQPHFYYHGSAFGLRYKGEHVGTISPRIYSKPIKEHKGTFSPKRFRTLDEVIKMVSQFLRKSQIIKLKNLCYSNHYGRN
jgi:hypothetical protein